MGGWVTYLVGPLGEEGGDGVVSSVEDEEGGSFPPPELEDLVLLGVLG